MTLAHLSFAPSLTGAASRDTDYLLLLDQLPPSQAKSSTDIGRIQSTPPHQDSNRSLEPLCRINQNQEGP